MMRNCVGPSSVVRLGHVEESGSRQVRFTLLTRPKQIAAAARTNALAAYSIWSTSHHGKAGARFFASVAARKRTIPASHSASCKINIVQDRPALLRRVVLRCKKINILWDMIDWRHNRLNHAASCGVHHDVESVHPPLARHLEVVANAPHLQIPQYPNLGSASSPADET